MPGSPRGLPASSASGESLFHVGDLPQWVTDVLHCCVLSDSPPHQSPFPTGWSNLSNVPWPTYVAMAIPALFTQFHALSFLRLL